MMVRLLCVILLLVMSGMALSVDKKYKYSYSFLNNFSAKNAPFGLCIVLYPNKTCKQLSPAKGEGFPAGKNAIFKCSKSSYENEFLFLRTVDPCFFLYTCSANATADPMPINIKAAKSAKKCVLKKTICPVTPKE